MIKKADNAVESRKSIWIFYSLWLIYAGVIFIGVNELKADDLVYIQRFNAAEFYKIWGGRILLTYLTHLFLNLPIQIWQILMTFCYFTIPIYIKKIAVLITDSCENNKNNNPVFQIVLIASTGMLMLLPSAVVDSSVKWITGSFNYLVPTTMLLISLYPFIASAQKKTYQNKDLLLAAVASILACDAEQSAAVLLVMGLVCILMRFSQTKDIDFKIMALFAVALIKSLTLFMAPGQTARLQSEIILWNSSFDMLTGMDKITTGLLHFLYFVVLDSPEIFLLMIILIIGCRLLTHEREGITGISIFSFFLFFLTRSFVARLGDQQFMYYYDPLRMIMLGMIVFWTIWLGIWMMFVFDNRASGLLCGLLYYAAVASAVVVGFSPSLFASDVRIFFLSYILLYIVLCILISEVIKEVVLRENG